jgi:hypothetical protein
MLARLLEGGWWRLLQGGLASQTFWTAVQAVGTLLAFGVVLLQLRKMRQQVQVTRDTAGYDLLFRLDARYDSSRTRQKRTSCAAMLRRALERPAGQIRDDFWEQHGHLVEAVLDEFELMALLLRRGVIDGQAVWSLFSYQIVNYYAYCETTEFLKWVRSEDSSFYEDFVFLHKSMQDIQKDAADPTFLDKEILV